MKNKLIIAVFALVTAAAAVLLLLPPDEKSAQTENRAMTTMPPFTEETAVSGEFAEGFESYISDNIGFRSVFTGITERLNSVKGVSSSAGKIVYADSSNDSNGFQSASNLLVTDDSVFEIFINNDSGSPYADALNHYAEKLGKNIDIYSMIVPTSLEFSEPIYANLQDSQKDSIDAIYSKLNPRIKTVDAYSALESRKNEYIYFRTDHHWTPLGAYYGYRAFAGAEGAKPVSKDGFRKHELKNFLGYLYNFAQSPELRRAPDTIEWYDVNENDTISVSMRGFDDNGDTETYEGSMFNEEKTHYDFFFGGDHPFVLLENSAVPNGKTLMILKDSYANAFAPWVINNYRRVILIDPRIYEQKLDSVLEEFKPDELLIMNYVFSTTFGGYCDLLTNLY